MRYVVSGNGAFTGYLTNSGHGIIPFLYYQKMSRTLYRNTPIYAIKILSQAPIKQVDPPI
jgi:hypothetical protein